MPDSTKILYLRQLRVAGASTDTERAELEHADNVYGNRWWLSATERSWYQQADELAEFFTTHDRWPRQLAEGTDERRLAFWLKAQRQRIPIGARRQHLDSVAPNWLGAQAAGRRRGSTTADPADQARAFAGFVAEYGDWPSRQTDDPDEFRLRRWRDSQRRQRQLHPERENPIWSYLDEHAPGWDHARQQGRKPKR